MFVAFSFKSLSDSVVLVDVSERGGYRQTVSVTPPRPMRGSRLAMTVIMVLSTVNDPSCWRIGNDGDLVDNQDTMD